MTNVHDVVQNIRDRKEEIDTLVYERNRICSELVSSIRNGEDTTGDDVEDYLIITTDASYSEKLSQMYHILERSLQGYENELILTIIRDIPENNDKMLHEIYRLAVLRSSSLVLNGGRQKNLRFDTDTFHTIAEFRNERYQYNQFAKVKLMCPDLQMRADKLSLWNIPVYKKLYHRRSSDIAVVDIIIGNDDVRHHMEGRGSVYWNVYCAMYRTLSENTQGIPRPTENVYRLYA